jgi:hypothetical protein
MRILLSLLIIVGANQTLLSQTDSLLYSSFTEKKPIKKAEAFIFNGKEHNNYSNAIIGIPYYLSNDWQKGTLDYEGVLYEDVFLKYDLIADELIIRHSNGFSGILLFTPRIKSFTLGSKRFVNLTSSESGIIKPGIYELLSNGRLAFYVKRGKTVTENIVSNILEKRIVDNNSFYIVKEGQYYTIRKQNAIMELVKDKKEAVNTRLKTAGLRFKKNPEEVLITIVEYYNQLSR